MAMNSKIEWTDHTVNFWVGCSKVSSACEFCYAESWDARFHPEPVESRGFKGQAAHWGLDAPRLLKLDSALRDLAKIRRRAIKGIVRCAECGFSRINNATVKGRQQFCPTCAGAMKVYHERPRVFINSMSDFFEYRGDLDEARLGALAAMFEAPEVDFLLLTKRPERILQLLKRTADGFKGSEFGEWLEWWIEGRKAPRNIWLGTTVENQEWADKRIPELLKVPAAVRFLSCEPLLGPVDLTRIAGEIGVGLHSYDVLLGQNIHHDDDDTWEPWEKVDWVICGGESGAHARPLHSDWARSLRDQCADSGVPFHFKQWGEWAPGDKDTAPFVVERDGSFHGRFGEGAQTIASRGAALIRQVGKKAAGRLLDGVEHNGMPERLLKSGRIAPAAPQKEDKP